jgi:hypothetical protein
MHQLFMFELQAHPGSLLNDIKIGRHMIDLPKKIGTKWVDKNLYYDILS